MHLLWILPALVCVLQVTEGSGKLKRNKGSMWWGIAKSDEPNNLDPLSPREDMDPNVMKVLRKRQQKLARENPGVLNAIAKGANQAIAECQNQFKHRRWNCSTGNYLRGKNLFGRIVERACRETAFIYAITSAAVTQAVARACAEGSIQSCTCDFSHQSKPPIPISGIEKGVKDWEWGGCSDNIEYGFRFSRDFVDAGVRGHNMREKIILHNNEAGRLHVQSGMVQDCKCHGISGSCTIKTCWMRVPSIRSIGEKLKDRFDGATRVATTNGVRSNRDNLPGPINNPHSPSMNSINAKPQSSMRRKNRYKFTLKPHNPEHKAPDTKDLVYLEVSPDFCDRNTNLGILGTHGRQCNKTSEGEDGCELMCCRRGFRTQKKIFRERCSCTFHWCCEVKCEICDRRKEVNTCL